MPGLPSAWDSERQKQVGRTKTGLLLLLIGSLIAWIPFIGALGSLLILVGAILVIVGRKAFGRVHSRNVMTALGLFIVGVIGAIVLGVIFAISLISSISGQDPRTVATAFGNALNTLLIGAIILAAISGIGSVLFTYGLQQQMGKIILWAAYLASIAVTIVVFAIINSAIQQAINDAVAGGTYNSAPLLALQNQQASLNLLNAIPSLLFAAAAYLAWARVNRGEIPPPTTPPAMPTMAPPAPPR
jgi:hypothetical protein